MIAFIWCSATSGFVLNVSIQGSVSPGCTNSCKGASCGIISHLRHGVLAIVLGVPLSAHADPVARFEASGFSGVEVFGDQIRLGSAKEAEQRPQTSPVFGGRLTYLPVPSLGDPDGVHLALGAELELSLTPSWTGYGFDGPRSSYFAPVFGARGNAIVRLGGLGVLRLHVVGGAGAATVVSASPFMQTETDTVLFWGPGASVAMSDRWHLRVDARQAYLPSRDGGSTATYELQLGIGAALGAIHHRPKPIAHVEVVDTRPPGPEPEVEYDSDGDGIPDKQDACPTEAETVNGIDDDDGCPELDPDRDGILGAADHCPDQAEDFDHFQDADGCPEDDNDKDGIVDAKDACPDQPETKNGFEDEDGCPDTVPANLTAALAGGAKVRFEDGKARLSSRAKDALANVLTLLRAHPAMHVTVTGHPDAGDDDAKASELAKKRAEAVKWYLVDQGVAADQLDTVVGAPRTGKLTAIELGIAATAK